MAVGPLFASSVPLPNCIPISDGSASLNLWVTSGSSLGTVTSVSMGSANGFTGSVTDPTTTPFIEVGTSVVGILVGDGVGVAAAVAGDFPTLNQNTTGSAATLTTPRSIYGASFNGSADLAGPVTVPFGGTGLATLTANNVILGNGTSTPNFVAPGTSGNVLTSNGTTWTSAAPSGGGTPGGSTTQLQYNNAGAFGGIAGATWNGTLLTLPNTSVFASSGASRLRMDAIASNFTYISFHANNDAYAGTNIGQSAATGNFLAASAAGDLCIAINGGGQRILFGTLSGGGQPIGFSIETANAGLSWGGSTSGTIPLKSNLTVFPATGQSVTTLQAASGSDVRIAFKASNDAYVGVSLGQAANANSGLAGSAAGDIYLAINGDGKRFLVGTASGGGQPIGFGVAGNNGGIFTSAPAGGTAANWKLGSLVTAAVTPDTTRYIELDVGGTLYKVIIST